MRSLAGSWKTPIDGFIVNAVTRTGCSGDGWDTLHTGWNNICWTNQFSALFPWSKFSWIDTDTNEMCTKQETHDLPTGLTIYWKNYMTLCEFGRKPSNLALPTGRPERTEILRKQLDYWYGLKLWGTQTHAHTYIHRNTDLLEKWQKLHILDILDILDIPPVCIDILQAKTTSERPQNSPPQRPNPSQVAVTCRGSRSSP